MTSKPAVEMRLMVENPLYAAYREHLEAKRADAVRLMLKRGLSYERMTRLAGEISSLDYALGLPAELLVDDSTPTTP